MMLTPWHKAAQAQIGTREIPGPTNNKKIMGWANTVGSKFLGIVYPGDSTPWCGLFVAWAMVSCGIKPPAIAIRAKAWATWGVGVTKPLVGAVAVFERKGGGHVGIIVGDDKTHLHILGGNQGDAVSVMRLEKSRCIAMRWPSGVPITGVQTVVAANGVGESTNEA